MQSGWTAKTLVACCALLHPQLAQAEDSIFLGNCERARIIQQQSTIDKIISYSRYEGIQRMHTGTAEGQNCKADTILVDTLTLKSRNSIEAVFDVETTAMAFGSIPDCMAPKITNSKRYGTVKFTTKLTQTNDICDLYIWSEWTEYSHLDPKWKSTFDTRVLKLNATGLVISQISAKAGQFLSPIAYSGVP